MSSESKLMTGAELQLRQQRRGPLITQVPLLDRLEEGGLPRGSLIELSGRGSAGRFTLSLAALSAATRLGESAAIIDLGDHLDPQGAHAAGADLSRLLWVRPKTFKAAMMSAEMVLGTGFSFVLLDFSRSSPRANSDALWIRLSRVVRAQNAVMMVSVPNPMTGSAADLIVQVTRAKPLWIVRDGQPRLLRGLTADLTVRRRKGARREFSGEIFLPIERRLPDV